MLVSIIPNGKLDVQISPALQDLSDSLNEVGLKSEKNTLSVPSVKADLIVGLTIATLAVNAVSALVAVVALWQARHTTYSVSISSPAGMYEVSGLSKSEVQRISREIEASGEQARIAIFLS
jgi:malonyl CoA-acyl carrier protein transacylase